MFTTLTQKLLLGFYVFLILSIPIGAYIVSSNQSQNTQTSAIQDKPVTKPLPSLAPAEQLKQLSEKKATASITPTPTPEDGETLSTALSFGPTMDLKLTLEGRPKDNQAARVFLGIASGGSPVNNPTYLLSFTIDIPVTGIFEGLSLAGLTTNTQYTAYIKGPAQIATSSAFMMSPSITKLNNGLPIMLTSGDLNEDNIIDTADYNIVKAALGTNLKSVGWNGNIDLNKDGVVNTIDLSIVAKNQGKTGNSGVWYSKPPVATSSGSPDLATPSGSPTDYQESGGYWLWVPRF